MHPMQYKGSYCQLALLYEQQQTSVTPEQKFYQVRLLARLAVKLKREDNSMRTRGDSDGTLS